MTLAWFRLGKFEPHLTSTCFLQLLDAKYLRETRETNISIFILFMIICYLDALKKSSKKKETRIKKEVVDVLQQASYRRKRSA